MSRQIIAMGGGGFSMEETPLLDRYIQDSTGKPNPKICFIPTASGDSDNYVLRFYQAFSKLNCRPQDLSLFRRTIIDLTDFVCSQDAIYVGGGNTANMMAIWKAHGLDKALKTAYENGTILSGLSAGAICWFEQGVTDSFGPKLSTVTGLGFLKGSNCPHYDGEADRRPAYHNLVKEGMKDGFAVDDGVALHFVDGQLKISVSSRLTAAAYRVQHIGGLIVEKKLDTNFLG